MVKPIHLLRNLGERMEWYLSEVGINCEEDLRREGYIPVYLSLKAKFPRVMNRMALYGALHDENCLKMGEALKKKINDELEAAKG